MRLINNELLHHLKNFILQNISALITVPDALLLQFSYIFCEVNKKTFFHVNEHPLICVPDSPNDKNINQSKTSNLRYESVETNDVVHVGCL